MSEEQIERWEEWLGNSGLSKDIPKPEATITAEPAVVQPVIFENLDVTVKASSWNDLAEKIKNLPLSKHGVIRFEMEEA